MPNEMAFAFGLLVGIASMSVVLLLVMRNLNAQLNEADEVISDLQDDVVRILNNTERQGG